MGESTALTVTKMVESEAVQKALADIGGDWGSPGRIGVWLRLAARRDPQIYECTPASVAQSITRAAGMKLEPDGIHGALVSYWSKKDKVRTCQFMPMYRGLIKLARDSGEVWAIEAEIVHVGDAFEFELGLNPKLRHTPKFLGDERDVTHAYALARFRNGGVQFRVCPKQYLDKVERSAKARGGMVWGSWYEEQCKKTAIKYLSKLLPQTPEMVDAIAHDNDTFGGVHMANGDALPPPTTKAAIAAALTGGTPEAEPPVADDAEIMEGAIASTEDNPPKDETLFADVEY